MLSVRTLGSGEPTRHEPCTAAQFTKRLLGTVTTAVRSGDADSYRNSIRRELESAGQQLSDSGVLVHSALGSACFEQQLAAPAARSKQVAVCIGDGHRDEAASPASIQVADHAAFGAERESVGRILDVAAGDDAAVVDEACCADAKVRVRRIRRAGCLVRPSAQIGPGDCCILAHAEHVSRVA